MSEPTNSTIGTTRRHHTTNPYEHLFGYSRGVRKGPFIFISGTTSTSTTSTSTTSTSTTSTSSTPIILHPDSAYEQAKHIFHTIIDSVEYLGGKRTDIIRVRMFVRDGKDTGEVGRALKESLGEVLPAATMIVGAGFVNPDMKVEIEADAVVL
ncbi:hypothetical protein D9756_005092 [Leucocoprinus leucothites]|uniref:YjgF-like protein n=1 Tax=Leucocoprinus leucothites TaxID=201217 RepID=A0A8H5G9K1_9AGAR|nr:hypothetical protein D9756_005092 [Leucoagaricus leucothites]